MVRTSIVAAAALLFGMVADAFVIAPAGRAMRMTEAPTSQTTTAPASSSGSDSGSGSRRPHVVDLTSRREALLGGAMALSSAAVLLGSQLQPALAAGPAVSGYYTQVCGDSVGGCVYGSCVCIDAWVQSD